MAKYQRLKKASFSLGDKDSLFNYSCYIQIAEIGNQNIEYTIFFKEASVFGADHVSSSKKEESSFFLLHPLTDFTLPGNKGAIVLTLR